MTEKWQMQWKFTYHKMDDDNKSPKWNGKSPKWKIVIITIISLIADFITINSGL